MANREHMMNRKAAKATLTTAEIEKQTAEFLKAGGVVEVVGKGKSGRQENASRGTPAKAKAS
ncbi:MAG TPA: hypothetical protein VFM78_09335 [Marinobacter sp.]|nr:hypothetical protein [Marinobacter sp.]